MRLSWLRNVYLCPFFQWAVLAHKVGQTDLVLACNPGSLVGLCMWDYKCLCAAVTICDTYTDRQHFDKPIWISPASCAKKWLGKSISCTKGWHVDHSRPSHVAQCTVWLSSAVVACIVTPYITCLWQGLSWGLQWWQVTHRAYLQCRDQWFVWWL